MKNRIITINGDAFRRVLVIGDIHGEWERLKSLWRKVRFRPAEDFLIFLGDYIDRGRGPVQVLRWVMRCVGAGRAVALRGNHEQMMLDYYDRGDDLWMWNGGEKTEEEIASLSSGKREECIRFARNLPLGLALRVKGKKYFLCHAGVDPKKPLHAQRKNSLLWIREKFFDHYDGEMVVVAGHTIVPESPEGRRLPVVRKHCILMDTGAYMPDGNLSCMDLSSGNIWQSE